MIGKIVRPNKDDYYLNIAKAVSERSTCCYWKYGAIIVKPNGTIAGTGYNGSTIASVNCIDAQRCSYEHHTGAKPDGSQGQCEGVHAEINAMIHSRLENMEGSTLYIYGYDRELEKEVPVRPDELISRMILNSGMKRIVTGSSEYTGGEGDLEEAISSNVGSTVTSGSR